MAMLNDKKVTGLVRESYIEKFAGTVNVRRKNSGSCRSLLQSIGLRHFYQTSCVIAFY